MDRPPRKTKVVNYCEAKDFDDDDDFASVKAPPTKKSRDVTREHKKSSSKSSSQESNSQKSRKPLDVRLHDRDLEAAITLSLLNNADPIKDQSPISKGDVNTGAPVDENTDPASLRLSNCSVDLTALGMDEITPEKESPGLSRQRQTSARAEESKKKLLDEDEDEDYEPKLTPDSESDEDFSEPAESEDEEFTVKKVSKTKQEKVPKSKKKQLPSASKKEKPPSRPAKSQKGVRSPPAAKPAPRHPVSSSTPPTSRPAISLSPAGGRVPKWNPPAQVGKSPTSSGPAVKSPGQGLRLGLSRLVRVKPLHPSVASH